MSDAHDTSTSSPPARGEWQDPAATPGAQRSPCPGLNVLANHGYMSVPSHFFSQTLTHIHATSNRTGTAIPFLGMLSALREVYHLSLPMALYLALGGYLNCGHGPLRTRLDLHDTAKHGVLEHDASLAHANASPGAAYAPTTVDAAMLASLLSFSSGDDSLSVADLSKARVTREASLAPSGLSWFLSFTAKGESLLILEVLGWASAGTLALGRAPLAFVREWVGHERLPEGWTRPAKSVGLLKHLYHHLAINRDMDRFRREEKGK